MAEARRATPAVYTVPPHRAFGDSLAVGLIALHGRDPLALAGGLVLLPSNRAVRAVQDAFVRHSGGGVLLPRLVPIGDPDLGEAASGALDLADAEPVPPAIEPLERSMLLGRLVQEDRPELDFGEALRLGADLARVIDQLAVEEVDAQALREAGELAPQLGQHWEASLARLQVLLERWPAELAERGLIDLSDRRNRLLDRIAKAWAEAPPRGFIVAAGVTTAAKAVARLLGVVSRLPGGRVVFPGLDLGMPDDEWEALGPHEPDPATGFTERSIETHPQFQLKLLLDRMSVGRGEVRRWRWGDGADAPAVRTRAITAALAPPKLTARWQRLRPEERRLTGVRALACADPGAEAQAIAIAMRQVLETPGRTAALVTPDRGLARRVVAHLGRWGVTADDSAGRPLCEVPPGVLLLAAATMVAEGFAPVPLLSFLKHPLNRKAEGRPEWLDGARWLDRALRGPRPRPGVQGIDAHLADRDGRDGWVRARATEWWVGVREPLLALEAAFAAPDACFADLLAATRTCAESFAGDCLWQGPAGRCLGDLVAELERAAPLGPAKTDGSFVPALRLLLSDKAVRPPFGHPRLFIFGLLEARLQRADLMILAGLNEGTWPALPAPDPWLAPQVRAKLGLPALERRIGLNAHDFAQGLGGPNVLVTRSRREARAPAIASRFWLRLEAMAGGMPRAHDVAAVCAALDKPDGYRPAGRPAPVLPVADRPKRIAVTDVDRLKADPFAFYARAVLRLHPMEAIDADPSARWRGTAVHRVLEEWAKEDRFAPDGLRARARALLDDQATHPLIRALWEPRLMEAVEFFGTETARLLAEGRRPLAVELRGEAPVDGVTLHGVADRIDRSADGTLTIVDYKTGQPPSRSAVKAGFSMQLGLLGLIAERGGFDGVRGDPRAFEYWSLGRDRKRDTMGYVERPTDPAKGLAPEEFTALAAAQLLDASSKWLLGDEPFTAKLHPEYAPYGDYDQLMRLDEWYGRDGA